MSGTTAPRGAGTSRRVVVVLLAAALAVGGATATASPAPLSHVAELDTSRARLDNFDRHRAMRHVKRLARRIGVRVRGTNGERRAARYMARKLRAYGYRVHVATFAVDGRRSRNVVARRPDAHRKRIVIGAHLDTVSGSPGANDNASGVAVVLELARIFAGRRQARWVRFVGFGAEEYGLNGRHHVGSQVYVDRRGRHRRRIAGMVSIDMIADGRPLIVGTAGIGPRRVAVRMHRSLRRKRFNVVYRTTCDCSDNGPFERAGIPAAFVWSGSEPNYHRPSDTPGNLSVRDLRRTGRAMRFYVRSIQRTYVRRLTRIR
jgi:hypothetical protein